MKQLTLILLLTASTFLVGQNLVPNPSFENYSSCPTATGQFNLSIPWFMPLNTNNASSDFYNACNTTTAGVPNNSSGYQVAHSGDGYAGVYTYGSEVREYIQVQLTSPLSAGISYNIELYVSPSEVHNYFADGMGVYVSIGSVAGVGGYLLPFIPQVVNPIGNVISDTTSWTLVSGTYIALGGEDHITIGNFSDDANTDTLLNNAIGFFLGRAYCLIDDVSVTPTPVGIDEITLATIKIHPNPTKDRITISLEEGTANSVTIRNSLGQLLLSDKTSTNQVELDLSPCPTGIYFLQLEVDGQVITKKVVKE
jgi:hypothetical protein